MENGQSIKLSANGLLYSQINACPWFELFLFALNCGYHRHPQTGKKEYKRLLNAESEK